MHAGWGGQQHRRYVMAAPGMVDRSHRFDLGNHDEDHSRIGR